LLPKENTDGTQKAGVDGETDRRGRISKDGSKRLRWALVQAAMKVTGRDEALRRFYTPLRRRAGKMRARKLAEIAWKRLRGWHRADGAAQREEVRHRWSGRPDRSGDWRESAPAPRFRRGAVTGGAVGVPRRVHDWTAARRTVYCVGEEARTRPRREGVCDHQVANDRKMDDRSSRKSRGPP
jgi:hypothetical protein